MGIPFDSQFSQTALAHDTKNAGAAVSATKLKAQIAGHLDDRTQENNALAALAQLVDQVRAHGGDMPRGSYKLPDMVDVTPSTPAIETDWDG